MTQMEEQVSILSETESEQKAQSHMVNVTRRTLHMCSTFSEPSVPADSGVQEGNCST